VVRVRVSIYTLGNCTD